MFTRDPLRQRRKRLGLLTDRGCANLLGGLNSETVGPSRAGLHRNVGGSWNLGGVRLDRDLVEGRRARTVSPTAQAETDEAVETDEKPHR